MSKRNEDVKDLCGEGLEIWALAGITFFSMSNKEYP
jgi:hypothetical protein